MPEIFVEFRTTGKYTESQVIIKSEAAKCGPWWLGIRPRLDLARCDLLGFGQVRPRLGVDELLPDENRSERRNQLFLLHIGRIGPSKGLGLARIFEIPILAFINFLPDVTMRSRGGERTGARSALTPELTFDRAVARVRRSAARCGQNPPERLPGYRTIAQ
ncbi:hypothetical protein PIB30_076308 [Stylosanthes scabra]|uniref:Uncharacterized protein n=1 Tax=Stylosanthes scabra TaxID=79078 RepID=A0ABU6QPY1_9FABA|nr:hypothetical protein [Stylosanthes scabra]